MSDKTIRHLIADVIFEKSLEAYEDAFDTAYYIAEKLKLKPDADADTLCPVEPEVKPASAGLLPCPFCGEDEWEKLGETYFLQHNYDCFIRNTSEPLISKTILRNNTESIWWNKRAGREPQSK